MEKRYGSVTDYSGNVVPGSTITVTNYPSGTIASLFRDNAGTPEDNPFVANDADGRYTFYAADGRYRIDIAPPLDANLSASSVIDVILSDTAYLQKASKAEVAALPLTQYDAGKKVFITSDDGGEFTIRYNATPGTYADNGGPFCGTVFIPTGGDGTIGIVRDDVEEINSKWFGVTGNGTTDDITALETADAAAANANILLRIYGTPLITTTFTPTCRNITFAGAPGNFSGRYPDSYIIKDAAMTTTAVIINAESSHIIGGGVVGVSGNTGDNIQIIGHSIRWKHLFSTLAGRDGLRIGESAAGIPNTNAFILTKPCCTNNGRYGININDDEAGGAPNANVGTLVAPFVGTNTSHGLYINNCFSNTIIGILAQSNVGKGVYLDERSVSNTFIGGDIENNTSGGSTAGDDLYLATSVLAAGGQYGGNAFINTNVGTPPDDNAALTSRGWQGFDGYGTASGTGSINAEGSWTPTIAGTTTAGTNTYARQNGTYFKNGRMVTLLFDVELSGNTVAMVGNLRISGLPFTAYTASLGAWSPSLVANLTFPASVTTITGAMNGANLDIYGYGSNIAITAVPSANIGATNGRLSGTITYMTAAVTV